MYIHSGAVCWICHLEGGADDQGTPLVRDCACRGDYAGFAHLSCIIEYAKQKCTEATNPSEFIKPWNKCPNCLQCYQGALSINLSAASVSHAKITSWNDFRGVTNIMEALRLQIESNTYGDKSPGEVKAVENLIYELLALVDQAKVDYGWVHTAPNPDECQGYTIICSRYEGFGYLSLGTLCKDINNEIGFYEKARNIFNSVGAKELEDDAMNMIEHIKARSVGDNAGLLENMRMVYLRAIGSSGSDSEDTILTGLALADCLRTEDYSIEAERLLTTLAATSHRVYGESHVITRDSVEMLNELKKRFLIISPVSSESYIYEALRYEDDGQQICVTGPIDVDEEEWKTFSIASESIIPIPGCPVLCHGLINESHLNGKLGEVEASAKDDSKGFLLVVHFEDKRLKPATVEPKHLRIAFELPSL